MPTLVIVTAPEQAVPLVRWGMRFALARGEALSLLAVHRGRKTGSVERVPFTLEPGVVEDDALVRALRAAIVAAQVAEPSASDGSSAKVMAPAIRRLRHSEPTAEVLGLIAELNIGLLVVGTWSRHHDRHGTVDLGAELMAQAPCDLMLLRAVGDPGRDQGRVLVAAAGGPHAGVALRLAGRMVESGTCRCTALHVSQDAGPEAQAVGRHHLDRAFMRAGLAPGQIETRIALDADVRRAIAAECERGYDLVIVGASGHGAASRLLFGTVGEHLVGADEPLSVAVIRRAEPIHAKVWRRASRWAHTRVPQLTRPERVELTDRIESGSRAGFDFLVLMVLSTAIAGLGLIQDSTAVVVGAMLVAPLMTPIVGAGLALVQGNAVLVKACAHSITAGFCTSLAVGLLLGLLTPIPQLTHELAARGGPNLLDLGIAFVSGLAAAYAMARPNLSAALPGVAIAAALVPPIATLGIAVAIGEVAIARGAVLLFGTNVVAIILGAALALYAVGLRPASGRPWPLWGRRLMGGLLGTLAVLAIPLSMVAAASWRQAVSPARGQLRERVVVVASTYDAQVLAVGWEDDPETGRVLAVTLGAATAPPADIAAQIDRALGEHLPSEATVRVRTELVSVSP